MAELFKYTSVQGTNGFGSSNTLYNVPTDPANTQAVISSIAICNTASATATYRIGFAPGATEPAIPNWLVYGTTVAANDTTFLTVGVSLPAGTHIRVSSSSSSVMFTAFISEIT